MQKILGLALQAKRCCEAPWGINQKRLSSRLVSMPLWVKGIGLTMRRSLPVFAYEQTSQAPVGMSQRCPQVDIGT